MNERDLFKRENWPKGAWDAEPDQRIWNDPATGYECAVWRAPEFGSLNGYVRVPEGHVLHGVAYNVEVPDELVGDLQAALKQPLGHRGVVDVFFAAMTGEHSRVSLLFDVHGSLTFSGKHLHLPSGWWYGFDCGHAFDVQPGMLAVRAHLRLQHPELPPLEDMVLRDVYRDFAYVTEQVESLARQLRAVEIAVQHMTLEAQLVLHSALAKAKATTKEYRNARQP